MKHPASIASAALLLFSFLFSCGNDSGAPKSVKGGGPPLKVTKDRRLNIEGLKLFDRGNFPLAFERFREAARLNRFSGEYPGS